MKNELAKLITEKRLEAGMSQSDLGAVCGMSDSSINRLENGATKNPDWQKLCDIAKALHFHPFQILRSLGYITEADMLPETRLHGLDDLTDEELAEVQKCIDFLHFKRGKEGDEK